MLYTLRFFFNLFQLDLVKLVKGMFSYIKMNISETEPIGVMSPSYFEKLHRVLNKYPPR